MELAAGCYYVSILGQAFAWTQFVPYLVSLVLTVLTFVTNQFLFVILGSYLHAVQMILWAIQLYLHVDRVDPVCQQYHTFAFPSIEAYYIGALVSFVIIWKRQQTVFVWLCLLLIFVVPCTVLVFLAYNRWYEVLISMAIGVVSSAFLVLLLRVYMKPGVPFLLFAFPLHWLQYEDTYIVTSKRDAEKTVQLSRAYEAYIKISG
jgi:hypothetical protein